MLSNASDIVEPLRKRFHKSLTESTKNPINARVGQFWRTRKGGIAKILRIQLPNSDEAIEEASRIGTNQFRAYPIRGKLKKDGHHVNWTLSGHVFSPIIEDEDDLIEQIKSKKQW